MVFVDGSTSKEGSGVGVILISSKREEIKLAIQLQFRITNNEVEHKALLIRLKARRNVGIV